MPEILTLGYLSLLCLPKALLEATYFHDLKAAKQTMKIWLIGAVCMAFALGLALLIDYFG